MKPVNYWFQVANTVCRKASLLFTGLWMDTQTTTEPPASLHDSFVLQKAVLQGNEAALKIQPIISASVVKNNNKL